jgi:hypothetical protein
MVAFKLIKQLVEDLIRRPYYSQVKSYYQITGSDLGPTKSVTRKQGVLIFCRHYIFQSNQGDVVDSLNFGSISCYHY